MIDLLNRLYFLNYVFSKLILIASIPSLNGYRTESVRPFTEIFSSGSRHVTRTFRDSPQTSRCLSFVHPYVALPNRGSSIYNMTQTGNGWERSFKCPTASQPQQGSSG